MSDEGNLIIVQPHGFNFVLTEKHCPELKEFTRCLFILSSALNSEYKSICSQLSSEINDFFDKGLSKGKFRDELTKLTGKPYLNWDFYGNRSRYWRMLIAHVYQQFLSRHHRFKLITLVKEWDATAPSLALWNEIKIRKIETNPNQLQNVLKWKKNGNILCNKVSPVPIDYSATDSSMISQEIVDNTVHVVVTCVRKEKFTISYPIPQHIIEKYEINKISKPAFTVNEDGSINVRFTVYTQSKCSQGENILGVDLGKVKPFSASSVSQDGYYSQELTYSRELERVSEKMDRLLTHKSFVYSKKMRLYSLLNSPCQPDESAMNSYRVLSEEYSFLCSSITRVKEHLSWLIARDTVSHAISSDSGTIHMEDLSWLLSKGGKWNHSDTQAKIEHTAASHGIRVHKVDAHGTSWEFPEEYECYPVPKSSLNTSTRMLTSPVSGKKIDKDRSASIAIACRPKKRRGKSKTTSNRKRVIQPKKCRDKHCSTPKKPKVKKKKIVVNKATPQYVSVAVDTVVGDQLHSQAVKNIRNTTYEQCPYMSRSG